MSKIDMGAFKAELMKEMRGMMLATLLEIQSGASVEPENEISADEPEIEDSSEPEVIHAVETEAGPVNGDGSYDYTCTRCGDEWTSPRHRGRRHTECPVCRELPPEKSEVGSPMPLPSVQTLPEPSARPIIAAPSGPCAGGNPPVKSLDRSDLRTVLDSVEQAISASIAARCNYMGSQAAGILVSRCAGWLSQEAERLAPGAAFRSKEATAAWKEASGRWTEVFGIERPETVEDVCYMPPNVVASLVRNMAGIAPAGAAHWSALHKLVGADPCYAPTKRGKQKVAPRATI